MQFKAMEPEQVRARLDLTLKRATLKELSRLVKDPDSAIRLAAREESQRRLGRPVNWTDVPGR